MSPMLVVGSVAFDTIHNPSGSHARIVGGAATYASVAGSIFTNVRLIGVVGQDFPDDAISMLKGRNIDLEGLTVAEGETFHWEGRYTDDLTARTTLATDLNVFADFHPRIPDRMVDTPFVMLGNIDPELQLEVLDQVRKPELVIADTMNFWIEGKPRELARLLERIDLLVINEEEARQLAGRHNIVQVAAELHRMGPRLVVIKRGEYGALLFEESDVFSAPAYPVSAVQDPTGAGDTFAGGLLGFLAHENTVEASTLRRAVVYGSAAASFCVEGIGVGRLAALERSDLEERYLAFGRLAHFATEGELAEARRADAVAQSKENV